MKKLFYRFRFAIGGALVLLFLLNQFLFHRGTSWSDVALNSSGTFANEDATERAAIHDLSVRIHIAQHQTKYTVNWRYKAAPPKGRPAVGYVEGTTIYWLNKSLEHTETRTGKRRIIADVEAEDIFTTAARNGNFDDLEKQSKTRQKLKKSQ